MRNAFIGSSIERLEDVRFLRGCGQLRRRSRARRSPARRDPAQPRRARPHPRDRYAARRGRGPACAAVITAAEIGPAVPTIPLRQEGCRPCAVRAAGDRPRQGALCRRAGRGRAGRQRCAGRGRARGDRARHRAAACGGRPRAARRARHHAAVRDCRQQLRAHADGGARRCRGRFRARALCPPRAVQGAAPHRGADGAARPLGRMGRGRAAQTVHRRGQGARFTNRRIAGEADGVAGKRDRAWSSTTSAAASASAASSIPRIS